MKCCPSAQLVFVISEKLNFLGSNTMDEFRRSVGINEVNFLTVVFLPVDESYKQASVSFAQQVLQNAGVKVVLQSVVMPHNILRIVQQTGVTASTWCSGLLNLFVRRVGEAQDQVLVLVHELIGFGEQLQRRFFDRDWRIEHQVSLPNKYRSRHFPIHGSHKAYSPGMQMEVSSVPLQLKIPNRYGFVAQADLAQLLVNRIGIRSHWSRSLRWNRVCESE